tara:strand:+ start:53 stop:256 length:204 start_codon:yes stop_codon:yes gene_type:complete
MSALGAIGSQRAGQYSSDGSPIFVKNDEIVLDGGWLPEVGNTPPPKKNNYGLLLLLAIGAYFVYKNK